MPEAPPRRCDKRRRGYERRGEGVSGVADRKKSHHSLVPVGAHRGGGLACRARSALRAIARPKCRCGAFDRLGFAADLPRPCRAGRRQGPLHPFQSRRCAGPGELDGILLPDGGRLSRQSLSVRLSICCWALTSASIFLSWPAAAPHWRGSLRLGNLEVAIVALVSISAFSAYRWLALTGNIAVLETPLAALSIAALYRRRYEISGAALGLMSTLPRFCRWSACSLFWCCRSAGCRRFAGLPPPSRRSLRCTSSMPPSAAAHFVSFVKATLGQIPRSAGALQRERRVEQLELLILSSRCFTPSTWTRRRWPSSALAFCGLILGVALAGLAQKTLERDDYAAVRIFGLAFLVCMLLLFRLKPYAFGTLVPSSRSRRSHFQTACCDVSATRR